MLSGLSTLYELIRIICRSSNGQKWVLELSQVMGFKNLQSRKPGPLATLKIAKLRVPAQKVLKIRDCL